MAENMDKKVWVRSLCDWRLSFPRQEGSGDISFKPNGRIRLTVAEIQAQVFNGSKFFGGEDGQGSHARLYIEDKEVRVLVGFEEEDAKSKQEILDKETVEKLLSYKTPSSFEKNVKEKVKTNAEKNFFAEEAKRQKLNDFDKIKFIEEYTGYKFNK